MKYFTGVCVFALFSLAQAEPHRHGYQHHERGGGNNLVGSDVKYECPDGYSLLGKECTNSTNIAAVESCPGGGVFMGDGKCQYSVPPAIECPSDYVSSCSHKHHFKKRGRHDREAECLCTRVTSVPLDSICPPSSNDTGLGCVKTVPAPVNYECPDGYEMTSRLRHKSYHHEAAEPTRPCVKYRDVDAMCSCPKGLPRVGTECVLVNVYNCTPPTLRALKPKHKHEYVKQSHHHPVHEGKMEETTIISQTCQDVKRAPLTCSCPEGSVRSDNEPGICRVGNYTDAIPKCSVDVAAGEPCETTVHVERVSSCPAGSISSCGHHKHKHHEEICQCWKTETENKVPRCLDPLSTFDAAAGACLTTRASEFACKDPSYSLIPGTRMCQGIQTALPTVTYTYQKTCLGKGCGGHAKPAGHGHHQKLRKY